MALRRPALLLILLAALVTGQAAEARAAIVPNPDPGLIAEWSPCEPGTGVTIVVDRNALADHKIYVRCALGPQPNGIAALQSAGFALEGTMAWGLAFLCRIDGQPTPAEEDCARTPGASRYWSYWHGKPGGRWAYSGVGAANPLSAAGIDAVQGWGFGRGVRIEPMNGSGPSSFTLPPAQASSVVPSGRARDWLEGATVKTAELGLQAGSGVNPGKEEMLEQAIALGRAGVEPEELAPIANLLDDRHTSSGFEYSSLELWANSTASAFDIDPAAPDFSLYGNTVRYAEAILAIEALGEDPTDFAEVDFRAALAAKIDAATGALRNKSSGGAETLSENIIDLAMSVQALASTGPLPAKALKTIDLLLARQEGSGGFGSAAGSTGHAIEALAAAREDGHGSAALDTALDSAGDFLESIQAPDGGVRKAANSEPSSNPDLSSTATGAAGLALAGHDEAAERAAKWVSRFQVTAEYAGAPDPSTNEPVPAEELIGAFAEDENALREILAFGLNKGVVPHGVYSEARQPTAEALLALLAAGPYGPLYAELDQGALHFANQTVGSQSGAQAVTLTNRDVRPVSIEAVSLSGPQSPDFILEAGECVGKTLDPGESCELSARFAPSADGIRDAAARVELAGADQAVELALSGTAVPLITHMLAATTSGAGAISAQDGALQGCTTSPAAGTCSGPYEQGSTVTLTAIPALHQKLTGWSVTGAGTTTCAGTTSPCSVTIGTGDVSIAASFAPITRTVSVTTFGLGRVGAGAGAIKQCATAPANGTCSGPYEEGTTVTLSATPSAGHRFAGWSGGGCSGTGGCSIEVLADTAVEAIFEQLPPAPGDGEPGGNSDRPAGLTSPPSNSAASVSSVAGTQAVGESRVARVGVLACPALVPCTVKAPRRVRVQIAGRWYGAWVLAPKSLAGGESAPLQVRLSQRAFERLGTDGATVRVKVWIGGGGMEAHWVEAQIGPGA